ncbi:MAG: M28 family peptidase [Phycisphaerales bacterium]
MSIRSPLGLRLLSVAALSGAALAFLPTASAARAAAQPGSLAPAAADPSAVLTALSADEQLYFQHVVSLSNEFFEGRAPGTRGSQLAAEYVEFYFKKYGLAPIFPSEVKAADGTSVLTPRASYRQPFEAGSTTKYDAQSVAFLPAAGGGAGANLPTTPLVAGKDFVPLPQSGSGKVEGPIAFAGYSIDGGPSEYNTFDKDTDLKGKIALILRYEPKNAEGKSKWQAAGESGWSVAATLAPKLERAVNKGAAGIIVVNPPGADDPRINSLELPRGGANRFAPPLTIPAVFMTIEQASVLTRLSGKELVELTKAADEKGGVVELADSRVAIEVQATKVPKLTDNVGAVLAGKGPLAEEFIVIGGHFDHLGMGTAGGSRDSNAAGKLHPGADDNASGTSGVLLAAKHLSEKYKSLPADANVRSIVFVGFCGEEGGLIGSRFFVKNSPIAAEKTYLMLNMDMIGRLRDDKFDVGGGGSAEGLADLIDPVFGKRGLKVRTRDSEGVPYNGRGPSDHASFFSASVPVLFFFTGLHAEYHTPQDFYWKINVPGAVRIVSTLVEIAEMFAARPDALKFTTGVGKTMPTRPEPTASASGGTPSPAPAAGGDEPRPMPIRVRFGIAPGDYQDNQPGVLVGDVFPGTSAALAGIVKGDRLTKWDGKEIKGIEEWMPFLRAAKPGDVVEITLVRAGKDEVVKVTLKGRETDDR